MANFNPSVVPLEMASKRLFPLSSITSRFASALFSTVSGTINLAATIAAGAEMIDAVNKCFAKNSCCTGSSPPKKPT